MDSEIEYPCWGLISESIITVMIGFIPGLNVSLGGRPLHFLHWYFPAMPVFILIIMYDETRKFIMRRISERHKRNGVDKIGWVEENTLY